MLSEDIKNRIYEIAWENYETAYGNAAKDIPYYVKIGNGREYTPKIALSLCNLFSDNLDTAITASNDLWCSLCHQYSFISSAAVPAYPFLRLALDIVDEKIQIEILDIMNGFAQCTNKKSVSWEKDLRQLLENDFQYYLNLTASSNEDIACFSQEIVSALSR